jgi:predicted CXXCH cytochrome family protein
MKTKLFKTVLVLLTVLGSTHAFGAIKDSKHDLTYSSNEIKANTATANSEICVFCHTPHGSNTNFLGAPLWNKEDTPGGTTYTTYGTTIAGVTADAAPSNSSKACLSCHDGVSAINSVVNAPGSGDTTDYLGMTDGTTTKADGEAFVMPSGRITNIGAGPNANVDLSNDHPVSITYTDGNASLNPKAGVFGAGTAGYSATWTTPDGTQNISSVLRSNKVECASCHDPHLGENDTFLRVSNNQGSVLCLGCHAK